MPFIPHSAQDIDAMLKEIGVTELNSLFEEIPASLRAKRFQAIPEGMTEASMTRLMLERAQKDGSGADLNFIGAGAYQHHIPWAVWDIVSRGEIMTSYTPYQAEASQGNLQLIYEYQSMMSSLMAMDCSNASLYDGGSSVAEAVLMAVRCHKTSQQNSQNRTVLILGEFNPRYREVLESLVSHQKIKLVFISGDKKSRESYTGQEMTAVVISQPGFLGSIQAVDDWTDWARAQNALVIGVVNPIAMSLLKPPGEWGEGNKKGADIVCGEGQSLGVPLASGGPYFGFICCKQEWVRQMPGRIVGRTVDLENKEGFCLTLQAREQHIRRSKATSNICTNQGLLVAAATVYMALLGQKGLTQVAKQSHANAMNLKAKLEEIDGVKILNTGVFFHEFVMQLPEFINTQQVLENLASQGIQAGFALDQKSLLVCSTEVHTPADHDRYVSALSHVLYQAKMEKILNQESIAC